MECAVMSDLGRHLAAIDREDAYEEWLDTAVTSRMDRLSGMGDADLACALTELVGDIHEFTALFDTEGELLADAGKVLRTWVSRDETIQRIKIELTRRTH
jgi:hypothetical protein